MFEGINSTVENSDKKSQFMDSVKKHAEALLQEGRITQEQFDDKIKSAELIDTNIPDDTDNAAETFVYSGIASEKEMVEVLERSGKESHELENNPEVLKREFIINITNDAGMILDICSKREDETLDRFMYLEDLEEFKLTSTNLLEMSNMDEIDNEKLSEALDKFSESLTKFGQTDRRGTTRENLDSLMSFHPVFVDLSDNVEKTRIELEKNQNGENDKLIKSLERLKELSDKRKDFIQRLYELVQNI